MIKSDLATEIYEASSSNYTHGRNGYSICKITPHHMAGVLSAEECGRIFQNPSRQASSNYGIGNDGTIACYVGEENRAWTSGNRENDYQAITIEVSDCDYGYPWPISDEAWNSLVNLCVDICKRYDFRLNYTGDKNGSLTRHNMFQNTDCPGQYLQDRFEELEQVVNAILDGDTPTPPTPPEPTPLRDLVISVQQWLNSYGYSTSVDGIVGEQTFRNIVKVYQNELNKQFGADLVVDGIYGDNTYNASWRTISKGAKGNITKSAQAMLICKGYEVALDGIYGDDTEYTIRGYQNDIGLDPTGNLDQDTTAQLFT